MARKTLTANTRKNKIRKLEKHIKKMTFPKQVTKQDANGRLYVETVTKYWGGQQALDTLNTLKAGT